MTNEVMNRKNISNSAIARNILVNRMRKQIKSYKNLRESVSAVASGDMSEKLFFTKLGLKILSSFVRDALFSIGVCAILNLNMILVLVYAMIRVFLIVFSVSRMFMDEMVGVSRK